MTAPALSLLVDGASGPAGRVTARPSTAPGRSGFVLVADDRGRALLRGDPRELALPQPAVPGPAGLLCVVLDVLLATATDLERARTSALATRDASLTRFSGAADWALRSREGLRALRRSAPLSDVRRTALLWDSFTPLTRVHYRANTVQSVVASCESRARRSGRTLREELDAYQHALHDEESPFELLEAARSAVCLLELDRSLQAD